MDSHYVDQEKLNTGNPTLVRQKLQSITQSFALPSICSLCNQFHKGNLAVCKECTQLMPTLGTCCRYCAYPLMDSSYLVCGQCIKNPPSLDQALIAYPFEEPLRQLIHRFKYHQGLYLASFLCQLMLNAWQQNPIPLHYLIPVPLHPKKLRARGFNQAAILTKLLGRSLNIPYELTLCEKTQNTAPQASLNGKQRKKNMRNAFSVKSLPSSHVTLVDDLFTTGSTANALALTLKKSGVKHVTIWCCARAVMNDTFYD